MPESHMAWCKQRALKYLDMGDLDNAFATFVSDIRKDPSTDTEANSILCARVGMSMVIVGDAAGLRRFIEGFAE